MIHAGSFHKMFFSVMFVSFLFAGESRAFYVEPKNIGSPAGEVCIQCHRETSPGIYHQWRESAMGQAGVNCYDCHRAEKTDPDAFEHKEWISIVVSPKDCSKCHEKEYNEHKSSHHADAVAALNSFDNFFGRAVWGAEAESTGCVPCHGSTLKVREKGKLAPETWPNTGIGRINPDGSKGSCTACHTRHLFSREQARRPDACGRCHMGPDHPQLEIYHESKHGVMYEAYRNDMNMDNRRWLAGKDYFQGPTCASCHMGAIPPQMEVKDADQRLEQALKSVLPEEDLALLSLLPPTRSRKIHYGSTHDLGSRLSWTLRPPISEKKEEWQEKRQQMQSVCLQCHGEHFVQQFYVQFDDLVELYNQRFAIPATSMRNELMNKGKLSRKNYDEKLDLIYWKLWQQEGRRARHGASMMGSDYAWRQGMQQVAERFYTEFIPEVREILGGGADKFLRKHGYSEPDN